MATLCDRRAGIGGDGVIRVVRTDATDDPAAVAARGEAIWFMDYRNADGSLSEMCGNGIRVLGLYLATHADVDPRNALPIATRDGIKTLTFDADGDHRRHGHPEGARRRPRSASETAPGPPSTSTIGNPHAVAFVDDLDEAGPLHRASGRTTRRPTPTASTSSSSYGAASSTSRCASTSAAPARPGPAAPAPAR